MAQAQPVTSRDLARRAGVSQATVSRVLTGNPHVKPETRERVLQVLEQMNYTPNALARAMKTGRTDTIGVLMTHVTSPFHASLLDTICRALSDAGLHMILWNIEHDSDELAARPSLPNLVDGLIFTSALVDGEAERIAVHSGIPCVLIHRGRDDLACDQVVGDNRTGATQVAAYFARAGHTRIGLVTSDQAASSIRDREEGFRAGLASAGVDLPDERVVRADSAHDSGHGAVRRLMASDQPPTAIFAVNDLLAFGVLDGARSLGITVPSELWVAGFDNVEMASWESFDLTTVDQPVHELVTTAIDLLRRRIDNSSAEPTTITLPCPLVIRGSTNSTPVAE